MPEIPGSEISPEAIDFTIGWWVNQVTSPLAQVVHDVVLDDGTVTDRVNNLHAYVKEHDPATAEQAEAFAASLRWSIESSYTRLLPTFEGGVERIRDLGLEGRTGYLITVDDDGPCPALDLALHRAGLGGAWLPLFARTRLMPAYVSATLSPAEPDALVWHDKRFMLPQCGYRRATPPEDLEKMTQMFGGQWYNDPARQQCGARMFHSSGHDYWRAVYDPDPSRDLRR